MNAYEIATEANALLQQWPGYSIVRRVMAEYADVKVAVAGGFLRNIAMQKPPSKDLDLFLGGPSATRFADRLVELGHGTRNAFGKWNWRPTAECKQYFDLIPIHDFRVGPQRPRDLGDILNHADFTCNGIGMDLRTGVIDDPRGGIAACRRRQLKMNRWGDDDYPAIGPDHPLTEGATRWFRALHFAARLNLEIEPKTKRWLIDHRHYLGMQRLYAATLSVPDLSALAELDAGEGGAAEPRAAVA
jgi:hypothetical protein